MTEFVYMGTATDPDEFRALAEATEAGEDGWRERVDALPVYVLTRETLASPPDVIAERLRGVAKFLENRRDGVPFGGHELAAQAQAMTARGLPVNRRKRGR